MKRITWIIILEILFGSRLVGQYSPSCHYEVAFLSENGECSDLPWSLVFEDEFEGTQIDHNKWLTYYGYFDRCHGEEPQVYLDENVIINNGVLHLLFKEKPGWYDTCGYTTQWRQYSSGMIYSKFEFLRGVFEAEIQIPEGTDYWPAFWLWGTVGEIDIFEFGDNENHPTFTLHCYINGAEQCAYGKDDDIDYSQDYHIYTVLWHKHYVAQFIDGDLKWVHWLFYTIEGQSGVICENIQAGNSYIRSLSFPYPTEGEHIIINLAGQENQNPYPLNRELKVKYVRAWQQLDNVCEDKIINNFASSEIKGNSIIVDGNITVGYNESIALTADENITLNPGLKIMQGAHFNSIINPNLCLDEENLKKGNSTSKPNVNFEQIDSLNNLIVERNYFGDKMFVIYPNPVKDLLNIYSPGGGILSISDCSGNILLEKDILNKGQQINFNGFDKGLYILRLNIDNNNYFQKILKF